MGVVETATRRTESVMYRWIKAALALLLRPAQRKMRRTEIRHLSEHIRRDIGLIDSHDPRKRR